MATDMMFASEVDSAHQNFAQWYAGEIAVWSFGSLASYAAACEKDTRFGANLLLKLDVHDELDGYDDFVCKALVEDGLALTLGGPGKSWRRSGAGWFPVDTKCDILDAAEEKVQMPWAFMGAFPGDQDRQHFFTKGCPAQRADCSECRRGPGERRPGRPRVSHRRRRGSSKQHDWRSADSQKSEGRWYDMADEDTACYREKVPRDMPNQQTAASIETLLAGLDLPSLSSDPGAVDILAELDALEEDTDRVEDDILGPLQF